MFLLEEYAIELRLNLRNALKLDLKFLERAVELMSKLHDFLNLIRPELPYRAAFASRAGWTPASNVATRSWRTATPTGSLLPRRSRRTCGAAPIG